MPCYKCDQRGSVSSGVFQACAWGIDLQSYSPKRLQDVQNVNFLATGMSL